MMRSAALPDFPTLCWEFRHAPADSLGLCGPMKSRITFENIVLWQFFSDLGIVA